MKALKTPYTEIDTVMASHWHADHTGGLLSFLNLRRENGCTKPCIIDLHPDRPTARGISPPPFDKVIARLPEDPTFEEITNAGGIVDKHSEGHAVSANTVWVSGEIPRITDYEDGLLGGVRWVHNTKTNKSEWTEEKVYFCECLPSTSC